VTYTAAAAAHLERSRNGELAGEVGGVAVLAGDAGQVRGGVVEAGDGLVELAARPGRVGGAGHHQGGVVGNVVEPGVFQRPPQPRRGRFGGGELVGAVLFGVSVVLAEKPTDMADLR
jgi:uncharacterized membrane protein YedE/YeeE